MDYPILTSLLKFSELIACVAGVESGRGRGNLGARESVWGAQRGKERNASELRESGSI